MTTNSTPHFSRFSVFTLPLHTCHHRAGGDPFIYHYPQERSVNGSLAVAGMTRVGYYYDN